MKLESFSKYPFSEEIRRAIDELEFRTPTEIQRDAIPILMGGKRDFMGLAGTGTGKTAAFAIPLLERSFEKKKGVSALILCPTRELAKQVSEQIHLIGKYKRVKVATIYGGSEYASQLRSLEKGADIVVGTPGRVIDHLERKTLRIEHLDTVVLDEADEMISMGFREDIETILSKVGEGKKPKTWLFSATMSPEVRKIADKFLDDPELVQVHRTGTLSADVTQLYYDVHESDKPLLVERLIDSVDDFYGLIFCQTKSLVTQLTESLRSHGYPVDCLHGDMDQKSRERAMKAFKSRDLRVLVCTDVASRGIDVKDLTHVINYSLPREMDLYIHRIGRTARGGKTGIALNLVTPSHRGLVGRIEKITRSRMIRTAVPDERSILRVKIARQLKDFTDTTQEKQVALLRKTVADDNGWVQALSGLSKEEVVARFLTQIMRVREAPKPVPVKKRYEREKPTGFRHRKGNRPRPATGRGSREMPWRKHKD